MCVDANVARSPRGRLRRVSVPLVIGAIMVACGILESDEPVWRVVVGQVVGPEPAVVAPDTVTANAVFSIRVVTFGSSSCTRAAGADVLPLNAVFSIVPMDSVAPGNVVCTQDLRSFPRVVDGSFPLPGKVVVAVSGRAGLADTVLYDTVIVVAK
jgi:hypothetical protein